MTYESAVEYIHSHHWAGQTRGLGRVRELLRLLGDPQAERLLLDPRLGADLSGYEAAVPLRFFPQETSVRCDERAGLVRRLDENVAAVDAALAATVPAGQGMRRIERIEIVRTEEM